MDGSLLIADSSARNVKVDREKVTRIFIQISERYFY